MKMTPVSGSSNVAAVGHDPDTQTMRVQYLSGASYDWQGVSAEQVAEILKSKSVGRAVIAHQNQHGHGKKVGADAKE